MKTLIGLVAVLALPPLWMLPDISEAQTLVPLGNGGFTSPGALAFDGAGNLFVADGDQIKELTAASGYDTLVVLPATTTGNFGSTGQLAIDRNGNVFVADLNDGVIKEILAPDYQTMNVIAPSAGTLLNPGLAPKAIAVDAAGNLFLLGEFPDESRQFAEIPASGGYDHFVVLPISFPGPFAPPLLAGLAIDSAGNLFTASPETAGGVFEVPAATGYTTSISLVDSGFVQSTVTSLALDSAANIFLGGSNPDGPPVPIAEIAASGGYHTETAVVTSAPLFDPQAIAIAPNGTIFVIDGNVEEVLLTPTPLAAAILPTSRAVAMGTAATVFATMINGSTVAANNCRVALPSVVPGGLSLTYQTTDPATNMLTGTANTPVGIGAGRLQTFVLSLESPNSFSDSSFAPVFRCDFAAPAAAAAVPGVNTIALRYNLSFLPTADIIALEAVASSDAILHVPTGGSGAFAVATVNAGAGANPPDGLIFVSANTGTTSTNQPKKLPLTITLCNSNPMNGQCLAPPAAAVSLPIAAGATPTFSFFVSASGGIPVDPAATRIFVTFTDQNNNLVGSTSVAVSSP